MVISYLGHECFKIQFGDLVMVCNPPAKTSKFKFNKFGADVVLQSLENEDMNGGVDFFYGEKKPFIVSGPGEYETGGIFVRGIAGESTYGLKNPKADEKRINTMYAFTVDGINVLFLGAQNAALPAALAEAIDVVDVIIVPIGGNGVFDAKEAYKVANNLEPKIIIPMHITGEKDEALKVFLKEAGEHVVAVDKLTIKRKDIEGKEGDVVVLAPQA